MGLLLQRRNILYRSSSITRHICVYQLNFEQSDILAIDGIGSKYRCVFFDKDENLIDLSDKLPIRLVMESYV